jgi:hypothetical protein
MRLLRVLLAAVVGALSLVVVAAAPSFACSCAAMSTQQYVDGADVVATATLTGVEPPPKRPVMSSGDPATYTFSVDRAYKGDVDEEVAVVSAVSGASCGLEGMREGRRYVVFASQSQGDDALWAGLCGGTAPWSADLEADVVAAAAPGVAEPPSAAPAGTAGGEGADDTGAATTLDRPTGAGPEEAEGGFLAVPVALVAGAGLVLLAGAYWLRLFLRR